MTASRRAPFCPPGDAGAPSLHGVVARGDARRAPLFTLDRADVGCGGVIRRVEAPADAPDWAQRLAEIGFLPGERVRVTAHGVGAGDPLAVRVGLSTFALRRAEAACVHLAPDDREP